ncbi:hypothetical protein IWX46DRAFT_584838 [Phyllosticta citricarpa]|uniref:Uncharacterized protein n=1 Tax=Phyllosticta citricarpa TaxID=55181 RepID=A0ABR1LDQ5_9PEZI
MCVDCGMDKREQRYEEKRARKTAKEERDEGREDITGAMGCSGAVFLVGGMAEPLNSPPPPPPPPPPHCSQSTKVGSLSKIFRFPAYLFPTQTKAWTTELRLQPPSAASAASACIAPALRHYSKYQTFKLHLTYALPHHRMYNSTASHPESHSKIFSVSAVSHFDALPPQPAARPRVNDQSSKASYISSYPSDRLRTIIAATARMQLPGQQDVAEPHTAALLPNP